MAEVLSQSEVESLLSALDPPAGKATAPRQRRHDDPHQSISIYDFKRPERVSKEQMRAFHALHDGFVRELGAALSGMLRTIVETRLVNVEQLTYSEFVFGLETPTCFNLLRSDGLDGDMILVLTPSIIFPVVDRLLGGGREPRLDFPRRPLTEIELRLVSRITGLALRGLESAWANICDLKLRVNQVESNPQLVQIVPPNEVVVLISFELIMGETRGLMSLCIPFNTIEPLAGKLSTGSWTAYKRRKTDPVQQLNLQTGIAQASVEMVVNLASASLKARDVMDLAVGDVIQTGRDVSRGAEVLIEGEPAFSASPGAWKGQKAIRIASVLERPRDLVNRKLKEQGLLPETPTDEAPAG